MVSWQITFNDVTLTLCDGVVLEGVSCVFEEKTKISEINNTSYTLKIRNKLRTDEIYLPITPP